MIQSNQKGIVFFDDDCLLCNKTVLFLLKRDTNKVLQFAPIGGLTFKSLNLGTISSNKNSVIFLTNGQTYLRSTAILRILYELPLPWKLATIFRIVPLSIRDYFYRYIAKNRNKFFGKNNICITNESVYANTILK
jgi:predicted DCC family thiol-disulfide oxidoreductase YuxK